MMTECLFLQEFAAVFHKTEIYPTHQMDNNDSMSMSDLVK